MIAFDEAWSIIVAAARPLGPEQVRLADASGRILAEPVVARVDWPPADVSAMDGYALRDGDPSPLRVVGESFPGAPFEEAEIGLGECVRIFTGAAVPRGADRVVMQEQATRDGSTVTLTIGAADVRFIRPRGADFRAGDALLPVGRRLDARAMVAAAGADLADVVVWRRPLVTILATGDELAEPGTAHARPDAIPDSVSLGVAALVSDWGGNVIARERVRDEPDLIRTAAAIALDRSDLLVMTGGASVGERDYAKSVLAGLGLDPLFAKVAMKPGKPVWFGRVGKTLVLGLPGNPTSALVTARLLLAPLIAGMSGADPADAARWRTASLCSPLESCGDRETFARGRWADGRAERTDNQDSGAQKALANSDLLIRQRAFTAAMPADAPVEVLDF